MTNQTNQTPPTDATDPTDPDVLIIGAGGAGLMCALTAARRGQRVLVVDHSRDIGEKIRISGGGRCNFTNLHTTAKDFLSDNPRFCISALTRFGPQDFIDMVEAAGIAYHEKVLGQLFCDTSSKDIIAMLVSACEDAGVTFEMQTRASNIRKTETGFSLHVKSETRQVKRACTALVIATGGKSIPKIGATDFGYRIAEQFGVGVIETRPGLVPFVFSEVFRARYADLAGVSLPVRVRCGGMTFTEALLFTHRGLSGPAILQASSYWRKGEAVSIDLSPDADCFAALKALKTEQPKMSPPNALAEMLPKRLALCIADETGMNNSLAEGTNRLADMPDKKLRALADHLHNWQVMPDETEGYRTAEVTVGGVDTAHLSSKTMECRDVPGLYFIGEVVDVTGHLGGFNFQWAWASGYAAGNAVGNVVEQDA